MIYWELFIGFLGASCFAFGGAYAAIPIIRDMVTSYGWLTDGELSYMIAVSESTPGPIMVNLATYVGASQGGILGSFLATFAVILPSFVIIVLIMAVLKNFIGNKYVDAVLSGLKACVMGIILATGVTMTLGNLLPAYAPDFKAIIIAGLILLSMFLSKKLRKKALSPIQIIMVAAVLGIIVYGIK